MLLDYGVGEDSWESLGQQGDPTSPSWIFIGRTDAEAEAPILWPPDVKSQLIRKATDAGRDWGQEEKGTTEDEMAGWHHRLDGHEFEWTLRVGDRQGGLVCCDSWGRKESNTTERLNWTELNVYPGHHFELGNLLRPWRYQWWQDSAPGPEMLYGGLIYLFEFISNWRIITILCWFLPFINMNQP